MPKPERPPPRLPSVELRLHTELLRACLHIALLEGNLGLWGAGT